ncbi:CBU_0592 family membrane protein [Jannaschia ovalis]|uniref:CBU-0592-like domain-containing protein n=1 Tax=Jannaschia ovalis TaxID=3038773 RepID=A0ABY8LF88_9RHOB|nr:hypothetical protein [Jannaschia sp. GRR-S6-38]WGH79942.1 hypothetical protein P8627_06705 [Jannaschia sp. GRR-S6-38]
MTGFDLAETAPMQLLGLLGAVLYICNYCALAMRLVDTSGSLYFLLQLAAATMVLLSLSEAFNVGAMMIQIFFITVSLLALLTRLRRARTPQRRDRAARLRPLGTDPLRARRETRDPPATRNTGREDPEEAEAPAMGGATA